MQKHPPVHQSWCPEGLVLTEKKISVSTASLIPRILNHMPRLFRENQALQFKPRVAPQFPGHNDRCSRWCGSHWPPATGCTDLQPCSRDGTRPLVFPGWIISWVVSPLVIPVSTPGTRTRHTWSNRNATNPTSTVPRMLPKVVTSFTSQNKRLDFLFYPVSVK